MKAIILCAGYGTRLGQLTKEVAKPMLPLEGRPLLEYIIAHLASHGFDDLAVNLHFQPESIRSYFGDGSRFGVRIHYSYEPKPLGTAGAVRNLEPWLADADDFLVIYGDILTDQDLAPLVQTQRRQNALATLLLHQRAGSNSLVQIDDHGRIVAFVERPSDSQREACRYRWVNSVVQVLNRRILRHIPPGKVVDLPRDVYSKVVATEKLYGVPLNGYRCAIDSPQRYEQVARDILDGAYRSPRKFYCEPRPGA